MSSITRNQIYLLTKDHPRPVFLRLLPRIAFYQILWMTFAVRNGSAIAYFRGLWAGWQGRHSMRQKHRALMSRRRIDDSEFLERADAGSAPH